jgi:hypothetical protein
MQRRVVVRTFAGAGLAFGALSVVAGARVLTGIDRPDYIVLPWLVIYNVAAGLVAIVAGTGLWLSRRWAIGLAWTLAGTHTLVLMVLIGSRGAGRSVATESVLAMLLRTIVWVSIALVAAEVWPSRRSIVRRPANESRDPSRPA